MTSEIYKLKHFHVEDYSGISRYNFDTKEWTDNKNPIC